MVDHMVGIEIGACALAENPGIINLKRGSGLIHGIRCTLHEQVAVIELDLLDPAVLHKRVFVDKLRLVDLPPVDLVDTVFVGQGHDALVLQIVTVDSEFDEPVVSVAAGDGDPLGLEDVESEQSGVEVQQEDVV